MKSRINPFVRFSSLITAATIAFAASAQAVDYTWDGGTGNWSDTNWNTATASGPTSAGNTATINSGTVTANVGVGGVDSITMGGGQLNVANNPGVYQGLGNLILQGGTVSGSGNYNAYGASLLGNLTVSGSAASTITGSSWFNLGSSTTFTVADATGDSASDLLVNLSLRSLPGSPDYTYLYNSKIIKEGAGTMEVTVHSYFNGGLDLNNGTLKLSGGNGGYGFFDGTVNVNSGTTLSITSDGTGFGYQGGWKPATVNINGGTVTSGTNHIFDIGGGINMTGGLLDSTTGSFSWKGTALNTLASANTATIAGGLNLRTDFGAFNLAVDVADGAAATDLLISANVTQASAAGGITKSGDGTMELSGNNSYTGATTVSGGTLVLSGASFASPNIAVNAGTLALSAPILDDGASVTIASGASMALNFGGNDTVGSLDIDGSGPLPADTYNSGHGTYGSYFTGTGSLVILAQDGTWTSLVDGNWSGSANWAGSIIAVGTDNTATFNAATGVIVTLDTNRIIGNLAFDVSDYTIAGANTLTLDASSTVPAISVTTGRSATISAGLAGNDGMEKTGDGTLVLSGVKSYTGGTTVTAGTLELNSTTADQSAVSGTLTVASGATLKLTGSDYTGLGRLVSTVTALDVNGGTVENTIQSWVTGATVSLTGSTMSGGTYQIISSGFNSLASATTSTISSNLLIRNDYGSSDLSINVEDGAATDDLHISGNIGSVLSAGVVKYGEGKLLLTGTNTYTGNTTINEGTLVLADNAQLKFAVTDAPAANIVTGPGTATFNGDFVIDTSGVNDATGHIWLLVDRASLTSESFESTFTVVGFDDLDNDGIWLMTDAKGDWSFDESSGELTLDAGNDYDDWVIANGVTGGENADDDADGLTNHEEYAFGLDPTGGSSVNPITVQLDKTAGTFTYTRRDPSLPDPSLTYTVWYSTDLAIWTQDTGATEGITTLSGEVQTVPVTISPALLTNPKLFIQVRAN